MKAALLALLVSAGALAAPPERLFDDFSQADLNSLFSQGWTARSKAGHPGVEGARWNPAGISLLADPAQPGNRLLRMTAQTDGSGAGTEQVQLCHQRKYLEGTYAARVRFNDKPAAGVDGDPVIQTFYAVAPLKHDYDPRFSELDWEYLANGGWGSEKTRLYSVSWQTVRIEPWDAHNQQHEEVGALDGWHVLMMQVGEGKVRWLLDGRELTQHGGRNYPVQPMAISFNLWFSPGGLLPKSEQPRRWQQDVDWVLHARNEILSPAQVEAAVLDYRRRGVAREDSVPASGLDSRCDI
ncbi:glycoside hydrolase family 16 protein [Pelomonas sp. SE-A7]|uniref:glycoside hydrolase family 16 protein n=1 Tax=Pelomonas sp. SE-A7 TaxID=3054953 RepID=UPI00259CA883|nr:glycoside hydrolase family 16 protein [Pelomonas sp. SE-A7]MDM4766825.1 glycoside hydrolase family 16 protein [Pelomonas sp. SE-A7]